MEPTTTNQTSTPSTPRALGQTCPWYQPLCRPSAFSRVAIAVIVVLLPFVGAFIGYHLAKQQAEDRSAFVPVTAVVKADTTPVMVPEIVPLPAPTGANANLVDVSIKTTPVLSALTDWERVSCAQYGLPAATGEDVCTANPFTPTETLIAAPGGCPGCVNLHLHSQRTKTVAPLPPAPALDRGVLFSPTTFSPYYIAIEPTVISTRDIVTGESRELARAEAGIEYVQCTDTCHLPEVRILRNGGIYVLSFLAHATPSEQNPATTTPMRVNLP